MPTMSVGSLLALCRYKVGIRLFSALCILNFQGIEKTWPKKGNCSCCTLLSAFWGWGLSLSMLQATCSGQDNSSFRSLLKLSVNRRHYKYYTDIINDSFGFQGFDYNHHMYYNVLLYYF